MKHTQTIAKISILMLICFFIGQTASADVKSVTADGFCYLESASDHSGTKVLFTAITPSAQTDSVYTIIDGSYAIGLQEGIYTIKYSHEGYQPYTIPGEHSLFVSTTFDDVTLSPGIVVEVSGPQNGVWESGNLYEVIGDISVPVDEVLVIEPGVTIKFMDHYSFTIYGTLMAEGTVSDSICFTSGQANPAPDSWGGIEFENSSAEENIISFSIIEYALKGLYFYYSSCSVNNNLIRYNSEIGILCYSSSPNVSYNMIRNNGSGNWDHGGIYCNWDSSPIIDHNTITYNEKIGILTHNTSSPVITYNSISHNEYCCISINGSTSTPFISYNTLTNSVRGIRVSYSAPIVSTNLLYYNEFGIQLFNTACEVINNTFSMNEEGIFCYYASPSIINNIFNENIAGLNFDTEPLALSNNSFWQNDANTIGDFTPTSFGEIVTVNSNGDPCDPYLNIFMDPLFVDPANLDFHLTEDSPCIDAGDPDPVYYDPDGTIADIGAFYYDQTILAPVINDISGEPTEGISPLLVQFSSDVTGQVTGYSWDFGDGGSSSLMNPSHTYTKVGAATISLTVTGPGGNATITKSEYITVFNPFLMPNPDFSAEPLSGFSPLNVAFTNLTPGEVDSLRWDFGDGITSMETNPNHEYQNPGLYTVSLTAYNQHGYVTETKTDYIEVLEQMEVTAAFEVSGNYGCSPFMVTFTDQSTGTINAYLWDFGDGETSVEMNPEHTFAGADEYVVTLTVTGSLNTDIATDTIIVELAEPFINSIEDRPDDQGGFVYLNFNKSFYDTVIPEDGTKSTEGYSFQRMDNENWVSLTFVYATGEENYTVELITLVDSSATSTGLTSFRVVAGMDEGTWISEPAEGYSVDNLVPSTPQDFKGAFVDDLIQLQWQPCPDEDFRYFAIYKTDENGQFSDEPFTTTISNGITDFFGASDCSYRVSAFDFNGNQSPASETLTAQNVQMPGGWSSLSAIVDPSFPEMENIFNSIEGELIILQNMTGAYWPSENLNTLGEWDNDSGYFVKSTSNVGFPIVGKRVESSSLALNAGWNLVPVLSECPVDIAEVFAGTTVVMVKEIAGLKLYWPEAGVSTLDELIPGKAYFVLMNNAGTINFPDCLKE